MDKTILLQEEIQAFIKEHENSDLPSLIMKKKYAHFPLQEIATQITGRKKAAKKLPAWYQTKNILYPSTTSIEQSSSETAAIFKASLISGKTSLDLTGGFGVDSYYFAKQFTSHIYVEENKDLAEITKHNFTTLNQNNIQAYISSAEAFLKQNKQHFDLIYIDPDRRPGNKRVIGFENSKPNLLQLMPILIDFSDNVMVKASPMLDISLALKQLKKVYKVIVLAIDNEVKELLFLLHNNNSKSITIRCININKKGNQIFEYINSEKQQEDCLLSTPLKYLFEPNAAIRKAGGYNLLCQKFNVLKINPNTHLFTSNNPTQSFPGRQFKIIGRVAYNKRQIIPLLTTSKANISTRNFPDTPEQVKKKLNLTDGGNQYLFGYRNMQGKPEVVICEKY